MQGFAEPKLKILLQLVTVVFFCTIYYFDLLSQMDSSKFDISNLGSVSSATLRTTALGDRILSTSEKVEILQTDRQDSSDFRVFSYQVRT